VYGPGLARSLCELSWRCRELDRESDALNPASEAVHIGRRIATGDSAFTLLDFAEALTGLGCAHAGRDHLEEALAAHNEAIKIRRELAAADSSKLVYVGASLINISAVLIDMGRLERAKDVSAEAVRTYRELTPDSQDKWSIGLSRALRNLSHSLRALGARDDEPTYYEQALVPALEAARLLRRLAFANPVAREPEFARSLFHLSILQWVLDQRDQALASAAEAAEIQRRLPISYEPSLAETLSYLGSIQWEAGETAQAIATTEELVALYRQLNDDTGSGSRFLPALMQALVALGERQSEIGDMQLALKNTKEAVAIARKITESEQNSAIAFASAAWAFANIRAATQIELREAIGILDEAIQSCLVEQLAESSKEKTYAEIASSLLMKKADILEELGDYGEATEIRRQIGEQ